MSSAQRAVAISAPEAGLGAFHKGYRTRLLFCLGMWEYLCAGSLPPVVREDNQAAIMVVNRGRNPTMRHMGRVQRIDISWLHEHSWGAPS